MTLKELTGSLIVVLVDEFGQIGVGKFVQRQGYLCFCANKRLCLKTLLFINHVFGRQAFFYQLDQQVAYGLPLLGRKGFEAVEQRIWQVDGDFQVGSFAQKYIFAQVFLALIFG